MGLGEEKRTYNPNQTELDKIIHRSHIEPHSPRFFDFHPHTISWIEYTLHHKLKKLLANTT